MSFSNPAGRARAVAADYIGGLLAVLGDRDPLAVLDELLPWLPAQLAGVSDAQLRQPEHEGKWSLIEVVQHLADHDLVYAYRIRMTLAMRTPQIQGFDQDLWASELRYREARLDEAMDQLRALRTINLRLLRSLGEEELERVGMHTERGEESVRRILQMLAAHDIVHRWQIERIKRAVRA